MAALNLGKNPRTGEDVFLSIKERLKGLYCLGVTGTGKTTFLVNMALEDIKNGRGLCFIDPHGDAVKDILSRIPPDREKDVILLNPQITATPFGLNLFSCHDSTSHEQVALTMDRVMHVFDRVWNVGTDTPRLAYFLRNITITLIENNMTMAEVPLLLQDSNFRAGLVRNVKNNKVRLFWQTYNNLKAFEQEVRNESTINKVDAFLTQALIENIVGQSKDTIDWRFVMDEGKIVLVELSPRIEGVATLLGSVIIGKILDAAYSRTDIPSHERRLFALYVDEFQRYATDDMATLLAEARKFGIATTIAHQVRKGQLSEKIEGATLNAGNFIFFKIASIDADIASVFDTTPQSEITGREEILVWRKSVLTHLLISGHQSSKVTALTTDYIVPLNLATKEEVTDYDYSGSEGDYKMKLYPMSPVDHMYNFDPKEIEKGLVYFNEFLYLSMTHKHEEAKKAFYQATQKFCDYLGFRRYFNGSSRRQMFKEDAQRKIAKLNQEISEKRKVLESIEAFSNYLAVSENWYSLCLNKQINEHFSTLRSDLRSFLHLSWEEVPLPHVSWGSYTNNTNNPNNAYWYEVEAEYNKLLADYSNADTLISLRRANGKRLREEFASELADMKREIEQLKRSQNRPFLSSAKRSHYNSPIETLRLKIEYYEGQVRLQAKSPLVSDNDVDKANELAKRCAYYAAFDTPRKVIDSKKQVFIEFEVNKRQEKIKAISEKLEKDLRTMDEQFKPEKPRYDAYYNAAMSAALELEADPILEGSGAYRDITRQVQTYSDRQHGIANILTHLARFIAWVKLGNNECELQTRPLPPRNKVKLSDLFSSIRRHNVEDGYLRLASEVEAEIRARHDDNDPPLTRKQRV